MYVVVALSPTQTFLMLGVLNIIKCFSFFAFFFPLSLSLSSNNSSLSRYFQNFFWWILTVPSQNQNPNLGNDASERGPWVGENSWKLKDILRIAVYYDGKNRFRWLFCYFLRHLLKHSLAKKNKFPEKIS